jgi:hypothetical protein
MRELSRLTKQSQSSIIAEILESSDVVFSRLIQVLTAADAAKAELTSKVKTDLAAAQGRIETQLGLVLDDFDSATRPLLDQAEGIKRRARATDEASASAPAGRGTGAKLTPMSNRGVRSDHNNTKTIALKQGGIRSKVKKQGVKVGGVEK